MNNSTATRCVCFTALIGAAVFLLTLVSACSHSPGSDKPRGTITITITNSGTPVMNGQVDLSNDKTGEGGGGLLDETGTTTIERVALGEYTLTINPPPQQPVVPGMEQKPSPPRDYKNIPATVRKIKTSPLKVKVKSGSNKFTFDLSAT